MPVYNGEKYLSNAIDSVLNQTYTTFEFIIIDDGSVDNSKRIIESYSDQRIRFVENEKNIGLIETLNKGLKLSNGEYICRFDCDDICMPTRLLEQLDFLESNPDYVLVGANTIVIDGAGKKRALNIYPEDHDEILKGMMFSNQICHPAAMFRNVSKSKSIFYSKKATHFEDYDFWAKLSGLGKFHNLQKSLLKYRAHEEQVSVIYKKIQDDSIGEVRNSFINKNNTFLTAVDINQFMHRSKLNRLELNDFELLIKKLNKDEINSNILSSIIWRAMCKHANLGFQIFTIAKKYKLNFTGRQNLMLFLLALIRMKA